MPVVGAYMVPHPPMIIPEVGRGSEKKIMPTIRAYRQVADEIAEKRPETIVIISPHATMYADYFHISPGSSAKGSFRDFGAPDVQFRETYDEALTDVIAARALLEEFPAGCAGERERKLDHGTMVPLYFIRQVYKEGKIIRVGLSGLPLYMHYELGLRIADAIEETGRRAVIVASGDLSHKLKDDGPYGFAPEGPVYDSRIMDVCARAAFGELFSFEESFCEKAAECGHRSFVIMAGALDGLSVKAEQLSHQDVTGVGYGICTFDPGTPDEKRHFLEAYFGEAARKTAEMKEKSDAYVRLAAKTIEQYVRFHAVPDVTADLPEEMRKTKAGVFVSIHAHGKLRGCIGTTGPTASCIAEEIIQNAVSAATRDPRFDPIEADELKYLQISVDVLGKPEVIPSAEALDVKKYGVIVSSGRKRGLLLPDLDGVDTVQQQISIAMQKGGIRRGEPLVLERFEVVRHV